MRRTTFATATNTARRAVSQCPVDQSGDRCAPRRERGARGVAARCREVEAAASRTHAAFARWALFLLAMLELGQGFVAFPEVVRRASSTSRSSRERGEYYVFVDELTAATRNRSCSGSTRACRGACSWAKRQSWDCCSRLFGLVRRAPAGSLLGVRWPTSPLAGAGLGRRSRTQDDTFDHRRSPAPSLRSPRPRISRGDCKPCDRNAAPG